MSLKQATDQELLRELLSRQELRPGPLKTTYESPHKSATIAIGPDHTVSINICVDALDELNK